jgi:large subunit ribosomal protein L28
VARCAICEKEKVFSLQVSHSHRKSARTWKPNLRTVRSIVNGTPKKIQVCSRCLRSGLVERAM